jgi:hypothetical protein
MTDHFVSIFASETAERFIRPCARKFEDVVNSSLPDILLAEARSCELENVASARKAKPTW